MDVIRQDLAFALRVLRKDRAYAAAVIVTLAVCLGANTALIGAGLLLASFQRLLAIDPGFVAEHVLTARLSPLESRYPDDTALRTYTNRVLERVRALPGVEAAGVSSFLPFSWDDSSSVIIAEGLVVIGLVAGMAGSLALRSVIASQLYGVSALDPAVMLMAIGVLAATSLVACLGPARRAARVNPVIALGQH